jgi:hypothetical protein
MQRARDVLGAKLPIAQGHHELEARIVGGESALELISTDGADGYI